MFKLIDKRIRFLQISIIIIVLGLISLGIFGLKSGIDFSAGSILTIRFDQQVDINELKNELQVLGHDNAIVQTTGGDDILIRTLELSSVEKDMLKDGLEQRFGPLTEEGFESVDPYIARQTSLTAAIAVAVASIGILLYITWAFRRMPKPFHYGSCAIVALIHDAFIVIGVFSILGAIFDLELNLVFVIGLLAVIGYSVNNTVVVFDRIRENQLNAQKPDFEIVVNKSLSETIIRSLATSLTTIIVVLSLLFFVGSSIQNFAIVMLTGIIAGTYSSLFLAPSILIIWEQREWRYLISR
jgi:preprotein translocase subunit SecF